MTQQELDDIETGLQIKLPQLYRQFVSPISLPSMKGNTDSGLWDDSKALIEFNQELRRGYLWTAPWPDFMFALGRDGGGSTSAINLNLPGCIVVWADRCHLDTQDDGCEFMEWAEEVIEIEKVNLIEAGHSLDITAAELKALRDKSYRQDRTCAVVIATIVLSIVIMFYLLR